MRFHLHKVGFHLQVRRKSNTSIDDDLPEPGDSADNFWGNQQVNNEETKQNDFGAFGEGMVFGNSNEPTLEEAKQSDDFGFGGPEAFGTSDPAPMTHFGSSDPDLDGHTPEEIEQIQRAKQDQQDRLRRVQEKEDEEMRLK